VDVRCWHDPEEAQRTPRTKGTTSQAAIRSLARTLTTDLKDHRIRVNALGPGHFNTAIGKTAGLSQEENDAYFERTALDTPLGRNGLADDIAAAALYLASDETARPDFRLVKSTNFCRNWLHKRSIG
jgi:NAD(P)-dependent dehydrogenase (short-subunit alcohol dehydrogenase family)